MWCERYRLVQLQTWRSRKSGGNLCGDVCGHCFYGTGKWDACRTCRARDARARRNGQQGVRALSKPDVLQLLAQEWARRGGRRV